MPTDFYTLVEEAREIEKKILPHSDYQQKIKAERVIDLSPEEYSSMSFNDLLTFYDRVKKVMATSKLGIYAPRAEMRKEIIKKAEEVELKVKEITTEALETAEKIEKQPEIIFEKPVEVPHEPEKTEEFEVPKFEEEKKKPEAFKEEFEIPEIEEKKKDIDLEKKPEEEITISPPSIPTLEEKEPAKFRIITEEVKPPSVPPILYKAPEQVARTSFEEIENKFKQEWGGEKDEIKIKRKMLELTKELFKEKSGDKREELKKQIVTLKNILSSPAPEVVSEVSKKSTKKIEASYSLNLFNTIINSHLAELSSSKDSISSSYTGKIEDLKRRFGDALLSIADTDDATRRKTASDFISNLTNLKQQLPIIISKYQKFLLEKHTAELEKLKSSIDKSDLASIKSCEKRLEEIKVKYKDELDSLRDSLLKTIDIVIESTNQRLEKKEEKPVPKGELNLSEAIFDINNTDEGSMLYYLHSKDPDAYKKYERKHISKYDALSYARKLMAKEKGLSAEQINKYFGK